jgi:hypothetical protein
MQLVTRSSFATLALLLSAMAMAGAIPFQNVENELRANCLPLGSE